MGRRKRSKKFSGCVTRGVNLKKIFIMVTGGVAYVAEESVPSGWKVEIIDFDNIDEGEDFRSDEARQYCMNTGW